ncbi:MAG TPA: O-antigen ligase family protein [Terriglobia bacterium]|nr:O-antigen ligase family protein [Terriglobia bacterium]
MSAGVSAIRHGRILIPCAAAGFLMLFLLQANTVLGLGALLVLGCLALMFRWPELGTLVVLFAIYSNIAVLAMRSHAAIEATAGSAEQNPRITMVLALLSLLLCVPLVHYFVIRKERLLFDRGFILMLVFFGALLASSLFAKDQRTVTSEILDFLLEGLVIYLLLTNVVRDSSTLRRAIWTLLLAGSLMGGLSILQKVTHTENNIYGGLAQVGAEINLSPSGREVIGKLRVAGPIGETNRYAQILLVLLPLAVLRFRLGKSRLSKAAALTAAGLIFGGLLLTYSRAILLTGVLLFAAMAWMRFLRPRHFVISALGVALFVAVFEPDIVTRMASLARLKGLFGHTYTAYQAPDSSSMRRYVENAAAWHTFLDHPVFGVGPGQFAEYYSQAYGNRVGLIEQTKKYRGHNLYLETLAETGLIGFASFLAILFVIMHGLWKQRSRLKITHPQLADTATGFFLCLAAYGTTAIFTHLSYQRYFWLLLALASSTIRIIDSEATVVAPQSQESSWLEPSD